MAWSWAPVPRDLLRDSRVLRLTDHQRCIFLSLYADGGDGWGLFELDEMALRVTTGLVDGRDLVPEVLAIAGGDDPLLEAYVVRGRRYLHLANYDDCLPADMRNKRKASRLPGPSERDLDAVENGSRTVLDPVETPSRPDLPYPIPSHPIPTYTTSRAGARERATAPSGEHEWPPGCEEAAQRWLDAQSRLAPTSMTSLEALYLVALDHPLDFEVAVSELINRGEAAPFSRKPIAWLRKGCEIAARARAKRGRPADDSWATRATEKLSGEARLAVTASRDLLAGLEAALRLTDQRERDKQGEYAAAERQRIAAMLNGDTPEEVTYSLTVAADMIRLLAQPPPSPKLWESTLALARERAPAYDIAHWFEPLIPAAFIRDGLVLLAPDESHAAWCREEYPWLEGEFGCRLYVPGEEQSARRCA